MTEKEEDNPQIQDGATKWKVREKDNTDRRESERWGRDREREQFGDREP